MSDSIHPGHVQIELGDDEVVLKPTGRALERLEKQYDGLVGVVEGLTRFRLKAYVDVVMAGSGAKPTDRDKVTEEVFSAGMINLLQPLTRFVNILGNGGRPPKDEEQDGDAGDPGKS